MKNRLLLHVLFAVLLLLTQQGVLAHSVVHEFEERSGGTEESGLPAELPCGQCLAQAQWASAITGATFAAPGTAGIDTPILFEVDRTFSPRIIRLFEPRAPPGALAA